MSTEAGPDHPNDQTTTSVTAHVKKKRGPTPKGIESIPIQVQGKVIGRDNKVVIAADVFKLAAMGCKDTEIAEWFGVDPNSLRYNFSVILLKGRETLRQSLRQAQLKYALAGSVPLLIFLGKNLLGQSDSPLASGELVALPWTDA